MLMSWVLVMICNLTSGQQSCDPRTFNPLDYPGRLTTFDVIETSPLKLRTHIALMNSTSEITFEGMVFAYTNDPGLATKSFDDNEVLATCRTLTCSESAGSQYAIWNQTDTCEYVCPDGRKANRKCTFMVDSLTCRDDAMNLAECMTAPLFRYASYKPSTPAWGYNGYQGVNLVCRECGEE